MWVISQYDLSSSTYSPDGRIFQVEYANKAVENSGCVFLVLQLLRSKRPRLLRVHSTRLRCSVPLALNNRKLNVRNRTALAIKAKDGVVLAVEKLVASKLLVPGANRRIQTVGMHVGAV